MEVIIKLNNQSAGRDKIARLLQYASKLIWYRFQQQNKNGVQTLKELEFQLSSFRKVLRFGRCTDSLYSSLLLLKHEDPVLRLTLGLGKIFHSLFLLTDHITWLGRVDILKINNQKWTKISNRAWLYSIVFNIVRDFYEVKKLLEENKIFRNCPNLNYAQISILFRNILTILEKHKNVSMDALKNICDVFIPLTSLGYLNLSPGTIGFLGVISSLAGMIVLLEPSLKMIPS